MDYYDGYLVVCLGRAQGGYECKKMETDPMSILVPHDDFLAKLSPQRHHCLRLEKFRPPKIDPNRGHDPDREVSPREVYITTNTDAIGLFLTEGPGDIVYIYQPNGTYLECTISD